MESCTLSDLRAKSRFYADERQSGFITDGATSLDYLINDKIREVRSWALSLSGGRSFWSLRETFNLISGTASYSLAGSTGAGYATDYPTDSLDEVTLWWTATAPERVEQVTGAEWERLLGGTWSQLGSKGYYLHGQYTGTNWSQGIFFAPTPASTTTTSIEYVPAFVNLVNSTDSFTGPEGFTAAVALKVAMQLRGMQDEKYKYLQDQLAEALDQTRAEIRRRYANFSPRIIDARPEQRAWDARPPLPPA